MLKPQVLTFLGTWIDVDRGFSLQEHTTAFVKSGRPRHSLSYNFRDGARSPWPQTRSSVLGRERRL